jgi:hypothetical protein
MGVTPYHGRFDGFSGALLFRGGDIRLGTDIGINLLQKQISQMAMLNVGDTKYIVVMVNNGAVELYGLNSDFKERPQKSMK